MAKREGVELRQSYLRVGKRAAIMVGRYTHAHQFKRARRELKFLRTRLGRIIRDIRRKIEGDPALEDRFGPLLDLAHRVRHQEQRQRGPATCCTPPRWSAGQRAPGTLRVWLQVSIATTAPKGGSSWCCAPCPARQSQAATRRPLVADLEKLTGVAVRRIHVDKGYRGHNYPDRFNWISGQVRRVTKAIRREMGASRRRRASDRPSQGRPPNAPQPSQGPRRRPHQRRARGRRLQLQPPPLVQGTLRVALWIPKSPPIATTPA